jgi:hypothetical protein
MGYDQQDLHGENIQKLFREGNGHRSHYLTKYVILTTFFPRRREMESSRQLPTVTEVFEALKQVEDPELAINIVDLGLVYHMVVQPTGRVDVD